MTGKAGKSSSTNSSQYNKIESEIERLRNENKWTRLKDYVSTLPNKDQKTELQVKFCIAESDLEQHLFYNPINLTNTQDVIINQTQQQQSASIATLESTSSQTPPHHHVLYEVEQLLKETINKSEKNSNVIEASILLAKLFYSQARYDEAAKQFTNTKINLVLNEHLSKLKQHQQQNQQAFDSQPFQLPRTDSLRQIQLFAEAHSLKSLCLEKRRASLLTTNTNSNYKQSDEAKQEEQEIIDSFELASLFAVNHSIQMHQYVNSTLNPNAAGAQGSAASGTGGGAMSGTATASLANSAGGGAATSGTDSAANVNLLTLNALNSSEDNLDLINPFYEIALQKTPLLYIKRGDLQMGMKKFRDLLLKKNIQSITSIRQILLKKFAECLMFNIPASQYSFLRLPSSEDPNRSKLFRPTNQDEEILLCLMLSQHLASKEVMLFRHAQFKQIRDLTFNNAVTSLDLLIIYLTYQKSYSLLIDKFELTMKYSFEQFYVWYQYGLTLINDGKFQKAYLILKECSRMRPDHVTVHLLLAKLAIENLFLIEESITWCRKVIEMSNGKNVKAYILLGCSLCIKAKLQKQHTAQINFYEQALDAFKKANQLDPCDYLSLFHMAHCYSILRQINESLDCIQRSLRFKPDDKDSLHLLALLLTSTKNYDEAQTVISRACSLYDDFELLFTKIRIEEILFGFNQSINSLLNLIILYKQKLQASAENVKTSGSTASSSITMSNSAPATTVISKNPPSGVKSVTQTTEYWNTFESASLLNLQHNYKLNEVIGKTITMLVNSDQLALKYGNSFALSKNMQQLLILVRILTQIGEFYLRHQKLNDAELCCQEMSTFHPMSYLHLYLKGRILEYKQEYNQAKICYQNALSINPYHIQSLQQMSLVLCELKNFQLAEKMIQDAISLNSSSPDSWQILARILDYQNDNQSAMKCYQTSLQLEATNPILPFTSLTRVL